MRLALAALALAGLAAAAPAGAVTVLNSSFEPGTTGAAAGLTNGLTFGQLDTTAPGWDVYTGVPGWTTVAGNRIEVHSNNSAAINAQNGSHFISLDGGANSAIRQSVALNVGTYMLSFWYSPQTNAGPTNTIRFNVGTLVSGLVRPGLNGGTIGTWTQIVSLFQVTTAGNYNLRFVAQGTANGIGGYLDNIQIAAVPAPAAGFVLLAGLGALAGLRRRKPV